MRSCSLPPQLLAALFKTDNRSRPASGGGVSGDLYHPDETLALRYSSRQRSRDGSVKMLSRR